MTAKYNPKGARVISIDVGVTNFAFAILGEDLIMADKRRVCAWKGSKDYVNMTETVLGWFKPHIVPGTVLVIERQMRAGIMRLFQIALEVAWYHTTGTRACAPRTLPLGQREVARLDLARAPLFHPLSLTLGLSPSPSLHHLTSCV